MVSSVNFIVSSRYEQMIRYLGSVLERCAGRYGTIKFVAGGVPFDGGRVAPLHHQLISHGCITV